MSCKLNKKIVCILKKKDEISENISYFMRMRGDWG